jgi:hypothetical protein
MQIISMLESVWLTTLSKQRGRYGAVLYAGMMTLICDLLFCMTLTYDNVEIINLSFIK